MGVDTQTYRACIGSFKHSFGHNVVTQTIFVDIPLIRRFIMSVMLYTSVLVVFLLENNAVMKFPHGTKNYDHGLSPWNCDHELGNLLYVFMPLTLIFILKVVGYTLLLALVLPNIHLTVAGMSASASSPYKCNEASETIMNVTKNGFTCTSACAVCLIGSVSFIGILLLMAGVEPNPGPNDRGNHQNETIETAAQSLLIRFGLMDFFPNKITLFHVISISKQDNWSIENRKEDDLPWIILRRLVSANSNAFCSDIPDEKTEYTASESDDEDESYESDEHVESEILNYLDVLLLTFQCCDPFLKQLLIQKMFLCKFAVPFMYIPINSDKPVISLWPLRGLVVETSCENNRIHEYNVFDLPTKCVAFCRLGRPHFSKSRLLNRLLSDESSKTFYNKGSECGNVSNVVCAGYIESFWLLTSGTDQDKFDRPIMFLNMRGSVQDSGTQANVLLSRFVDTLVLIVQKDDFINNESNLENIVSTTRSVIIVITGYSGTKINASREKIRSHAHNNNCLLSYITTYNTKKRKLKSEDRIATEISQQINEKTGEEKLFTLEQRLDRCTTTDTDTNGQRKAATDELCEGCIYGKEKAIEICETMKLDEKFASLQKDVAPNQSKISRKLGNLIKELKREKNIDMQDEKREEISKLRKEVTETINEPIRHFIQVLEKSSSLDEIDYFLGWLGFYISRKSRDVLSRLKLEYKNEWSIYLKQKKEQPNQDHAKDKLTSIESQIDNASFSVGHLFREIGIVYDSILELGIQSNTLQLPPENEMAAVIGKLIANGRQYELIDGDSLYLPYKWLSKLFTALDNEIDHKKVKTVSVLGVQSSGKSTLLNIMFGALFSTSAGRCTRGIHAQLIPLHEDLVSEVKNAFHYVLILDTEGLRPTEVIHKDLERDNELATLITGLGNITIVNVMGENTQEIRDILQIVAHAFLRIKLANKGVNLHNRCILVQQNITSILAGDQMNEGLNKLIESLDEMTRDSALCEGLEDIRTFNQVIQFDVSSDVWYQKNVWQGDPPFARVNRNYSEKARNIKWNLFKHDFELSDSSYKTLNDFIVQTDDLYQGILKENFVFSFKNSLERREYWKMDTFIQDKLWQIESTLTKQVHSITQEMFSKCRTIEEIDVNRNQIKSQLNKVIDEQRIAMESDLKLYFETCEHRNIVVQWKESQRNCVTRFFQKINNTVERTIRNERHKTETNLQFQNSQLKSEKSLQRQTLEYAKKHSVKGLQDDEVKKLFEAFWIENFGNDDPASSEEPCSFREIFLDCLYDIHNKQKPVLDSTLKQMNWYENPSVSLGFKQTGIEDDDICTWFKIPKLYRHVNKVDYDAAKDAVTSFLLNIGETIDKMCEENKEIKGFQAREFLHEVNKTACKEISGKVKVKESTYIKIDVHVSIVARRLFEEHNTMYRKTLCEKFNVYKRQQKVLFEQLLDHRRTEDTVAAIIADIIYEYINKEVVDRLTNELPQRLRGYLPATKNLMIIEICTDFVNSGDFSDIVSYVLKPMNFAKSWLERKSKSCLFDGTSSIFSEFSMEIIKDIYSKVLKTLEHPQTTDDKMISTQMVVKTLLSKLNESKIYIPDADFSAMLRCNQAKEINLTAVWTAIADKLKQLKSKLPFSSYTKDTVWWKERSPYQDIFERIWGCTECCPYCREPCQKSNEKHSEDHTCVQHRPECCSGTRWLGTEQAAAETCNYHVQSSNRHLCGVFGFKCNDNRTECPKETHDFRKYREVLKDWYIHPNSDMYDSSKFWLWFVGKFKNELAKSFGYKVDNIPASWSKISAEDAKESLRSVYG